MGWSVPLSFQETFVTIECCQCGVVFAVSDDLQRNWRKTKQSWYCPNGHSQSYTEGTVEKLQKELDATRREVAWQTEVAKTAEKRRKQEEKKHKALQRRINAGVCPCCHRTVAQMARHMATKHPDYQPAAPPASVP